MAGMVMGPVVRTLETALPLIMPIAALLATDTFAAPPRYRPKIDMERLWKKSAPPVCCRATPKTRKPIRMVAAVWMGRPSTPSAPMMCTCARVGRS